MKRADEFPDFNGLALMQARRHLVLVNPDPDPAEASLSARELEILRLLARGASNSQLARELGLSVHTVKRHVARVIMKLGVASRYAAASSFYRAGRMPEDDGTAPGAPVARTAEPARLTPREWEVLSRIANGARNHSIALDLGLSEHTVKRHATNIFFKLGVNNRLQAAALFHASNLRPPGSLGGTPAAIPE